MTVSGSPSSYSRAWWRTLTGSAAVMLFGLLTSILTARLLGAEGRGWLAALLLGTSLVASAAQLGLSQAWLFSVRQQTAFAARHAAAGSLLLVLLAAALLAAPAFWWAGGALRADWGLALFAAVVIAGYTHMLALSQQQDTLQRFNRVRALYALLCLLGIAACWFMLTPQRVLWIQALLALLLLAVLWRLLPVARDAEDARVDWRPLLSQALRFHGTTLLGLLLVNIDKVVMYVRGSLADFGLYAVALSTTRLVATFQNTMATALYARFAGQDNAELSNAVETSFRLSFLPLLLLVAIPAALGPWLLPWVFGEAFAAAAPTFAVLLFEAVIGGGSWIMAQQFNAAGKPGAVLLRQCAAVLPVLLLLYWLPAQQLGFWLACLLLLASVIRLAITLAMYRWLLGRAVPRLWPDRADLGLVVKLLRSRWK